MTDPCIQTLRVLGHELRRPLTVIRGAATLLIDDSEALPPSSRQQMLALIDGSATSMADLIDDLLTAVHLEMGDLRYELRPVELAGLVNEAIEAARREDPARGIDVRGMDGLQVEVDREQALRALRAVLSNALHFSPEGSPVEVVAATEAGAVTLRVLDRGPGIPEADRERAFARFGKLDEQRGGAGLGLFLARGLTAGMGGGLSVEDREDGGAAVCFTLKRRG